MVSAANVPQGASKSAKGFMDLYDQLHHLTAISATGHVTFFREKDGEISGLQRQQSYLFFVCGIESIITGWLIRGDIFQRIHRGITDIFFACQKHLQISEVGVSLNFAFRKRTGGIALNKDKKFIFDQHFFAIGGIGGVFRQSFQQNFPGARA